MRARLAELAGTLPEGVENRPVYDRAPLIERAVANLQSKLLQQGLIVALVCFVFLAHLRSAFVAILLLPLGILFSFIIMFHQGINRETSCPSAASPSPSVYDDRRRHRDGRERPQAPRSATGCRRRTARGPDARRRTEVGPSLFFSLLIITASFLPIFALEAQEGRLFKPLAFTKTYAMAGSRTPLDHGRARAHALARSRPHPAAERSNTLEPGGRPAALPARAPPRRSAIRWRGARSSRCCVLVGLPVPAGAGSASEFMPPLDEGDLLYMPTTLPGVSVTKAQGAPTADGPHHRELSRGRAGLRKGGAGRRRRRTQRRSR